MCALSGRKGRLGTSSLVFRTDRGLMYQPHFSRLLPLLLAPLSLACSGGGGGGTPYTVTDSAGIQILESFSPALGRRIGAIDPEPLVRIGREEEGPYLFGFVSVGTFLSGGRIAVADGRAREVRVFDDSGAHLLTLGGRGSGPGEFQQLGLILPYPGDSMVAFSQVQRTATFFPLGPGESRTFRRERGGNFSVFGMMDEGPFVAFNPGSGFRPDLEAGLQWVETDILAISPEDGSSKVIGRLGGREQWVEEDGNTRSVIPPRYSIQAVDGSGFYWATADRYEIKYFDEDGGLKRLLRRPVEPISVEPAEVEAYIEANLDRVRRREGEEAVPRYRRGYEESHFGDQVPFFATAFVDKEERLWVSGPIWPSLQGTPRQWSVFSKDGIWQGDLEAPEGLRIVDCMGDRVLGIFRDEFDVPFVQVHRLTGGLAAGNDPNG